VGETGEKQGLKEYCAEGERRPDASGRSVGRKRGKAAWGGRRGVSCIADEEAVLQDRFAETRCQGGEEGGATRWGHGERGLSVSQMQRFNISTANSHCFHFMGGPFPFPTDVHPLAYSFNDYITAPVYPSAL